MAEKTRIGLREVRALQPGQTVWDTAVIGFHIRRQTGKTVAYRVKYRTADGSQRGYTIGQHGKAWTPDTARDKAREVLGDVAKGIDPAAEKQEKRKAETVAELCDLYWAEVESGQLVTKRGVAKKASTLVSDRGRIENHVKPLLGRMKVGAVRTGDVEDFLHAVATGKTAVDRKPGEKNSPRGGSGVGSRTTGLLGAIFDFAVRRRMRSDNPVRGVRRPADKKRDRRLSDNEYAKIGDALRRGSTNLWLSVSAASRFLLISGWRSGEALGLRWGDVDLGRRTATLRETKTGESRRALSHAACGILNDLGRGADAALVFPSTRGSQPMTGFGKRWARIARLAGIADDVSPHILRHSYASVAADLGYSELTIGALIGHKGRSMTSRYTHAADAVLLAAADVIARRVLELMGEPQSGDIVPFLAAG